MKRTSRSMRAPAHVPARVYASLACAAAAIGSLWLWLVVLHSASSPVLNFSTFLVGVPLGLLSLGLAVSAIPTMLGPRPSVLRRVTVMVAVAPLALVMLVVAGYICVVAVAMASFGL